MMDWLTQPAVEAAVALGLVGAVVYIGYRVAIALRPSTSKADTNADNLAQNFEEMQLEGDISAEELRSIKSVLGEIQKRPQSD